ncbi:MAG: hypothetical protein ING19_21720 [Azospirillum sp.]|nr:hypothetical protein [Azospirillum sp.]
MTDFFGRARHQPDENGHFRVCLVDFVGSRRFRAILAIDAFALDLPDRDPDRVRRHFGSDLQGADQHTVGNPDRECPLDAVQADDVTETGLRGSGRRYFLFAVIRPQARADEGAGFEGYGNAAFFERPRQTAVASVGIGIHGPYFWRLHRVVSTAKIRLLSYNKRNLCKKNGRNRRRCARQNNRSEL